MSDWVILRTSGRSTLHLAKTLSEDGFEAWTPVESRNIRIPRANVRRTVQLPIMPSYVFARAHNLIDLIQLSKLCPIPRRNAPPPIISGKPHARTAEWRPFHANFSVMHYHDRIPVISDGHLQSLRTIEAKRAPKKRAAPLMPGLSVRVKQEGGSFAGMKGRVERSDEGSTLVCFDNRLTVKIATALLDASEIVDLRKAA